MPQGSGTVHNTEDEGANNIIGYVRVESMKGMKGNSASGCNYSEETMYKPYLKKGNGIGLKVGDKVDFTTKKASIKVHGESTISSHIWILEIK